MNRGYRLEDASFTGKQAVHVFKQAEVPTVSGHTPRPINADARFDREDLRAYTTVSIDPTQGSHITSLCDRGLCCDFHLEISYNKDLAEKSDAKLYK